MLRALQAEAQRQDCAWLASLPPLPATNGAAITALLHTFVQQRCASMPCLARPCMGLASRLLEQKGSLRSFAEAIQSGRLDVALQWLPSAAGCLACCWPSGCHARAERCCCHSIIQLQHKLQCTRTPAGSHDQQNVISGCQ